MINGWHLHLAVRALDKGALVLHATEGVWGLACNPFDESAVARLLALKGRSAEKGLIVIGASIEVFEPELGSLRQSDRDPVVASWPGAETWILPNHRFPYWITGSHHGVAVRVPGHPQARALAAAFDGPLVSTSANPSGLPAPITGLGARRRMATRDFPGADDYILPGEVLRAGVPSRIRTPAGELLRG